ncbi:MAG TPA: periplasmic heavy metal sensor [bacterium]|nr:periplasmic heavy metal sensor [bacterium]
MKTRLLMAGLILSLAFNLGFLAAAGYRYFENRKAGDRMIRVGSTPDSSRHMTGFELAPEQARRIRQKRMSFQPRVQEIRMRLHEERTAIADLLTHEPVDTARIVRKIEGMSRLRCEIEKEVVFQLLREQSELTPEQRRRFIRMMTDRMIADQRNRFPPDSPPGSKRLIRRRLMNDRGVLEEFVETHQPKEE